MADHGGLHPFEMLWESALVASVNQTLANVGGAIAEEQRIANEREAAKLDATQRLHNVETGLYQLLRQCRHGVPTMAGPQIVAMTWDLDALDAVNLADMTAKDRLQQASDLLDKACEALEETTSKFYQLASWEVAAVQRALDTWFEYWGARNVEAVRPMGPVWRDDPDLRANVRKNYNEVMEGVDELGDSDPSRRGFYVYRVINRYVEQSPNERVAAVDQWAEQVRRSLQAAHDARAQVMQAAAYDGAVAEGATRLPPVPGSMDPDMVGSLRRLPPAPKFVSNQLRDMMAWYFAAIDAIAPEVEPPSDVAATESAPRRRRLGFSGT